MRAIWILEVLDGNRETYPKDGKWCAWEESAFQTRDRARKALKSHKDSCWTKCRIVRYVPEKK